MTTRFVAPGGSGDGTSEGNAAALTSMDAMVQAAAVGAAPNRVTIVRSPGAAGLYKVESTITISHGGTLANPVTIGGLDGVPLPILIGWKGGQRSLPYRPSAAGNADAWRPPNSTGEPGVQIFTLASGANHLRFENIYHHSCESLLKLTAVHVGVSIVKRVWGRNVRRTYNQVDSTLDVPSGNSDAVINGIRLRGFSRGAVRMTNSSNIDIRNHYLDCQNNAWDGTPIGIQLAGNASHQANQNIRIERVLGKNIFQPDYTTSPATWLLSYTVPPAGSFYFTLGTKRTADIVAPASTATIKAALVAAQFGASGDIFVTGGGAAITIAFGGQMLNADPGDLQLVTALDSGDLGIGQTGFWAALDPGYFQGDIITDEEFDRGISIRFSYGADVTDGFVDLKSDDTWVAYCTAERCKRNFRTHPSNGDPWGNQKWSRTGVTFFACKGTNPTQPKYPIGYPLAGQFGTGIPCQLGSNGIALAVECDFTDDGTSQRDGNRAQAFFSDGPDAHLTIVNTRVTRPTGPESGLGTDNTSKLYVSDTTTGFIRCNVTDTQV